MSEWKKYNLSSICSDITYGYTASANEKFIGPKFLRITDIVPDRIDWSSVPYCKAEAKVIDKYKLKNGDIVIARTGATTGYNKVIKNLNNEAVFASYLIRYKVDTEKANPYYIGYILQSTYWYDYINSIVGGSAQPGANAKLLGSFTFLLPTLPEQNSIVSVLSSLDDKIDLLNRQNKTLEAIAETLFRQWFIEEADESWEEVNLKNICENITKGTTPTTLGRHFVTEGINFLKVETISDSGNFIESKFAFIDIDTDNLLSRSRIQTDDILVTIAGTIGRVALVPARIVPANTNQAIAIIRIKKEIVNPILIYLLLKSPLIKNDFDSRVVHAVQPNLSLSEIGNLKFRIPSREILNKLTKQIISIFDKKEKNYQQIHTLTQLRDTLLPKLMSGEVRVKV